MHTHINLHIYIIIIELYRHQWINGWGWRFRYLGIWWIWTHPTTFGRFPLARPCPTTFKVWWAALSAAEWNQFECQLSRSTAYMNYYMNHKPSKRSQFVYKPSEIKASYWIYLGESPQPAHAKKMRRPPRPCVAGRRCCDISGQRRHGTGLLGSRRAPEG